MAGEKSGSLPEAGGLAWGNRDAVNGHPNCTKPTPVVPRPLKLSRGRLHRWIADPTFSPAAGIGAIHVMTSGLICSSANLICDAQQRFSVTDFLSNPNHKTTHRGANAVSTFTTDELLTILCIPITRASWGFCLFTNTICRKPISNSPLWGDRATSPQTNGPEAAQTTASFTESKQTTLGGDILVISSQPEQSSEKYHSPDRVKINNPEKMASRILTASLRGSLRFSSRPLQTQVPVRQARLASSFLEERPSPPRLPAEQQAEFERLQRAAEAQLHSHTQVDSSPSSSPGSPIATPRHVTTPSSTNVAQTQATAAETKTEAAGSSDTLVSLSGGIRKGAPPEFEGDKNPKTGEIGGPKNEPLRWGAQGDWSFNGRVTDF